MSATTLPEPPGPPLRDSPRWLGHTAGHETTAHGLTWMFLLLAENPAVRARVYDEVDSVLGGRRPGADDVERLPLLLGAMMIQRYEFDRASTGQIALEPTVTLRPLTGVPMIARRRPQPLQEDQSHADQAVEA